MRITISTLLCSLLILVAGVHADDTCGTAGRAAFNGSVTGQVDASDPIDYHNLSVPRDKYGNILISLSGPVGVNLDMTLGLNCSNDVVVTMLDESRSPDSNEEIRVFIASSAIHYIGVEWISGGTGDYTLTVMEVGQATSTPTPVPTFPAGQPLLAELDSPNPDVLPGETLEIFTRVWNRDTVNYTADLYIAVEIGGSFYAFPTFADGLAPWFTLEWPAMLDTGYIEIFELPYIDPLPADLPLNWYAAAFDTNTADLRSEVGFLPTTLLAPPAATPTPTPIPGAFNWPPQTNGDPFESDFFGEAVALDNDWMVVGAPGRSEGTFSQGAVYIYDVSSGSPVLHSTLVAPVAYNSGYYGRSVAIDGDLLVVGAPGDDTVANDAGRMFIYRFDGNDWNLEFEDSPSTLVNRAMFGSSLDISGTTVVVGTNRFGAYIYEFGSASWGMVYHCTVPGSQDISSRNGQVRVLGNVVIIGTPDWDTNGVIDAGIVHIYEKFGANWDSLVTVEATTPISDAYFGASVHSMANLIAIGAPFESTMAGGQGKVYLYGKSGDDANLITTIDASPGVQYFGYDVAFHGDDRFLVGAPRTDFDFGGTQRRDWGSVHVIDFDGSTWAETENFNTALNYDFLGGQFGSAIAGDNAGNWVIGAPQADAPNGQFDAGKVYYGNLP